MEWSPGTTLHDVKMAAVKRALDHHGGNKTRAAAALDISIRALRDLVGRHEELREYRITSPFQPAPKAQETEASA